jgi:hypothetical protein
MKTVLTWLVEYDLDMMTEAVFRINYGGMLGWERYSSPEREVISIAMAHFYKGSRNEDEFPVLDEPLFNLQQVPPVYPCKIQ